MAFDEANNGIFYDFEEDDRRLRAARRRRPVIKKKLLRPKSPPVPYEAKSEPLTEALIMDIQPARVTVTTQVPVAA